MVQKTHTVRCIFPVGYASRRVFDSMTTPNKMTTYTSSILDGDNLPRFQVVADDNPETPIICQSSSTASREVLRKVAEINYSEFRSNTANGPQFYGLTHINIAHMIQQLPGAKDLENYVWKEFKEVDPRRVTTFMKRMNETRSKQLEIVVTTAGEPAEATEDNSISNYEDGIETAKKNKGQNEQMKQLSRASSSSSSPRKPVMITYDSSSDDEY